MYHASLTHLESIDALQCRFVNEICLTEEIAFLEFNMAPLKLRRDIGALGRLHKIQLGEAHPDFGFLFARNQIWSFVSITRHGGRRHGRQFEEIAVAVITSTTLCSAPFEFTMCYPNTL